MVRFLFQCENNQKSAQWVLLESTVSVATQYKTVAGALAG